MEHHRSLFNRLTISPDPRDVLMGGGVLLSCKEARLAQPLMCRWLQPVRIHPGCKQWHALDSIV